MKLLIASDIHGSAKFCGELMSAMGREKPDSLVILGDILYHGPRNDLPEGYDPKAVIELLSGLECGIFCVRGNCDSEVDQMVLPFPIMADYCLLQTGSRRIFASHGHHLDSLPGLKKGDIVLFGHTHIPEKTEKEGVWYLNPGSVSIPKAGSARGYMVLEENRFIWRSLDGADIMDFEI